MLTLFESMWNKYLGSVKWVQHQLELEEMDVLPINPDAYATGPMASEFKQE